MGVMTRYLLLGALLTGCALTQGDPEPAATHADEVMPEPRCAIQGAEGVVVDSEADGVKHQWCCTLVCFDVNDPRVTRP